jgi:exodeoxyribonuclease VII small subunit
MQNNSFYLCHATLPKLDLCSHLPHEIIASIYEARESMPKSAPAPSVHTTMPADIAGLSFEAALAELEQLVKQLEDGKAKLDDAIGAYERGTLLRRHCEAKLQEAQLKIERVTQTEDGAISSAPFTE